MRSAILSKCYQTSKGVFCVGDLNGSLLVVRPASNKALQITGFAANVFPHLKARIPVHKIISFLTKEAKQTKEVTAAAERFIVLLLKEKLIELASSKATRP
ncbi:MAG: hypothetical protein V4692_03220 [Bdellovibrionota bacterium]